MKTVNHLQKTGRGTAAPDRASTLESLSFPTQPGNRVQRLLNGEEIFCSMLDAIQASDTSISFETYVYWSGAVGRRFAKAFARAARRGVEVRVVLDAYGTMPMESALVEQMTAAGVQVHQHRPVKFMKLRRSNHRSHRKLMIVDGQLGFIGGVGIADPWAGNARTEDEWRDTHYRIEGPVVADMQTAFLRHWPQAGHSMLQSPSLYPPLEQRGETRCRLVAGEPLEGIEHLFDTIIGLVAGATRTIDICSPYFLPHGELRELLFDAAARGVQIRILTAGQHTDMPAVRSAFRHEWADYLGAGMKVSVYAPTMIHAKSLIVDGRVALIGSANFDNRSSRINDEACLLIEDQKFAQEETNRFILDCSKARTIDREEVKSRPLLQRIADGTTHLASPFL